MEYTIKTTSGKVYERHAWTGGDDPTTGFSTAKESKEYREIRSFFFRESLHFCGGLDLWACAGTSALERARIFWNQASLDAWRTLQNAKKVERSNQLFTKGDRVILARVRHEEFRGQSGTVIRFVKKWQAYDIELANGGRYRADKENVDAADA